tara:strand:+ start:62053 stop:66432 length:4380 start_codon:yes stop_codon:yes gene_type:complete
MPNIIVKNTTSQARTALVTAGVPLSRAFALQFGDVLVANNAKTGVSNLKVQWYGVGNVHDNGVHKYARVTFEVDLSANEEKTVSITKAVGSTVVTELSFVPSFTLLTGLVGASVELSIEGEVFAFPMSSLLDGASLIEGNGNKDFYQRHRHFTHMVPTLDNRRRYIWVDMVVDIPARLDQCTFFFRYGYYRDFDESEPNRPEPVFLLSQDITLRVVGPRTKFRWEEYKMANIQTISPTHKLYTLVDRSQPGADRFVAGSSNVYKGVFCFTNTSSDTAELEDPVLAIAEDWRLTENYPVTGVMPEYPDYVSSESNAFARSELLRNDLESRVKNPSNKGPYNWSTIVNNPDTTGTGAHGERDYAYGMRGMPILRPLNYNWIPFLEFTARQEGLRHIWYYDTNGEPMSPTEFLNNGVLIFHSLFFVHGSTRGFSREGLNTDMAKAPHNGTTIYGPERQHHTVKMCILQGLITMDWYSLEFAKMSVVNWINNNRSDTGSEFINSWEASRAAGRTFENAAFLYEFTYDQELKFHVEQTLNFNLNDNGPLPNSQALNKIATPGGTEVLRRVLDNTPTPQSAGLGPHNHWRPWEESTVSLGFFCLSKAISRSQPNDPTAAKLLEISRDVSAAVVTDGYFDVSSNTDRRAIVVTFPSSSIREAFQDDLGDIGYTVPITGNTSGATGLMFLHHKELEFGINTHRIYTSSSSGTFQVGETISTPVSSITSATINRTFNFLARKSYMRTAPTNGLYKKLTFGEEEVMTTSENLNNFPPQHFPLGSFRYHVLYYVYNTLLMSGPAVAKHAAAEDYYGVGNAEIIAAADRLIAEFEDDDNGDFDESISRFYGYIDVNFGGNNNSLVSPAALVSDSTLPAPTVEIETNSIDAVATPIGQIPTIRAIVSSASSSGTVGSTDVSVNVAGQQINVITSTAVANAGALIDPPNAPVTITLSATDVTGVVVTNTIAGQRKNTFVHIGTPVFPESPSFVHEAAGLSPGQQDPTVFNYHKTSLLNTILEAGIITDYYLLFPEFSAPGQLGSAVGINGQTLRPEGFTWYVPGSTEYENTAYEAGNEGVRHTISQAGRGTGVRGWTTTMGAVVTKWLDTTSSIRGITMNETYDTNVEGTKDRVMYTPNFLGATTTLEGSEHTFVSPNRLISTAVTTAGLILEGAVTPLELINYQQPYQAFNGGSPDAPSIAEYMKMYYNIAVETSVRGVSQMDSWIYHVNGIPSGTHNLSGNLKLDIVPTFDQMVIYDVDTQIWTDISFLLTNEDQEIKFGKDTTIVQSKAVGAEPVILPSYLTQGRGAIICANTKTQFIMAVAAGLDSVSDSLHNVNFLTFENFAVTSTSIGGHKMGITSVDNYNPGEPTSTSDPVTEPVVDTIEGGDAPVGENELSSNPTKEEVLYKTSEDGALVKSSRKAGWVGRRMYVVFGVTYTEVFESIIAIDQAVGIKSTIDSNGLHPYERPAII